MKKMINTHSAEISYFATGLIFIFFWYCSAVLWHKPVGTYIFGVIDGFIAIVGFLVSGCALFLLLFNLFGVLDE